MIPTSDHPASIRRIARDLFPVVAAAPPMHTSAAQAAFEAAADAINALQYSTPELDRIARVLRAVAFAQPAGLEQLRRSARLLVPEIQREADLAAMRPQPDPERLGFFATLRALRQGLVA